MSAKLLAILQKELLSMQKANDIVKYSFDLCASFIAKDDYTNAELDHLEALTARFARLSDILIQKIFRLIDSIELADNGTVRDRINRAEKKAIIKQAEAFFEIRILSNTIAHVYSDDSLRDVFIQVYNYIPELFDCVTALKTYCKQQFAI